MRVNLALFSNKLTKEQYINFLEAAWFIYRALERELALHSADPGVGPIHFPTELERGSAVEADLKYYTGKEKHGAKPGKWVLKYLERIAEIGQRMAGAPEAEKKKLGAVLLMAHSYTRYFGDLSGGLLLRELKHETITSTLDLKPQEDNTSASNSRKTGTWKATTAESSTISLQSRTSRFSRTSTSQEWTRSRPRS